MKNRWAISVTGFVCALGCILGFAGCGNGEGERVIGKNDFASGSGTQDDPYVISAPYQWNNISKHLNASFELSCNLNMGDFNLVAPIGTAEKPFVGNIDGNGYEVRGAAVGSSANAGLFGVTSGATIENLGFASSTVKMNADYPENTYMGSFVAVAKKGTIIRNCYSENISIEFPAQNTKYVYVGGFAGSVESVSEISWCNSNVNITQANSYSYARFCIGGFARNVSGATLGCCTALGAVSLGSPISLGNTLRVCGVVEQAKNAQINNIYSEMSNTGGDGIHFCYFGGNVDTTFGYCMNFGEYNCKYKYRYEKCALERNDTEDINLYFDSTSYVEANNVLDESIWSENIYWKKGGLHPELITYGEFLNMDNK